MSWYKFDIHVYRDNKLHHNCDMIFVHIPTIPIHSSYSADDLGDLSILQYVAVAAMAWEAHIPLHGQTNMQYQIFGCRPLAPAFVMAWWKRRIELCLRRSHRLIPAGMSTSSMYLWVSKLRTIHDGYNTWVQLSVSPQCRSVSRCIATKTSMSSYLATFSIGWARQHTAAVVGYS